MVVLNLKLTRKKAICFVAAATAAVIILLICLHAVHGRAPDTATCDEAGTYSLIAENADEQREFIAQFGLKADPDSAVSKSIVIPSRFNSVYGEYNELQKKIGLDLSGYKGKTAEMITFELENSKTRYAVLLVYEGRVIGAHLTNGEYGQENLPLI